MKENQNIKFKQFWRDEYLKWMCGFANVFFKATSLDKKQLGD